MKFYRGNTSIAALIHKLPSRLRQVQNFRIRPPHPREETAIPIEYEAWMVRIDLGVL